MFEVVEEVSIAVLGAMNPAIHTADWYRYLEQISKEELEAARSGQFVATNLASQFSFEAIRVVCTDSAWQIHSTPDHLERITKVACKVFESLTHTPVSAFGLNFNAHVQTDLEDAAADLCARMEEFLPDSERPVAKCSWQYQLPRDDGLIKATLETSNRGQGFVYVGLNYHHEIKMNEWEHFDLSPILMRASKADRKDAESRRELLVRTVLASARSR